MLKIRKNKSFYIVFMIPILISGCGKSCLESVNKFSATANEGTNTIKEYYNSINERELDLYLQQHVLEKTLELSDTVTISIPAGKTATYLTPIALNGDLIPKDKLNLRLSLLNTVTEFGTKLSLLASSDRPAKIQESIEGLSKDLQQLKSDFESVQGIDPPAKNYIEPLGSLIGVISKVVSDNYRWSVVKESVIDSEPHINTILDFISKDLDQIDSIPKVQSEENYNLYWRYYNKMRQSLTMQERSDALNKILKYRNSVSLLNENKPSKITNGMKSALSSLVQTAKSNCASSDLSSFKLELDLFLNDVLSIQNSIKKIVQ